MARAWIGLGANIEPRREHLRIGVRGLSQGPLSLIALSEVYETQPMDVLDQPKFLNMGAVVEAEAGKKVVIRRGPRTLDLDLWAYDAEVLDSDELTLPHPRIAERPFVLIPLLEIDPQWRHPVNGLGARAMLERLPKPWPEVRLLGKL
jgi:2-amino-4-hydroxy-6-hydroxymethyldihydropteridine diphosphokinase